MRRVAVVTGSGKKRVGHHVATALAAAGYAVAVHYRTSRTEALDTVQALEGYGVPAAPFAADLTDEAAVTRLADAVFEHFRRVDVLVNAAAVWNRKPLPDVTAADVRENFESNTLTTFLCCQRFGLRMVEQPDGGSIINVGDWADVRPYPDYAAYFPSKAAIPGMTRCFAVELGTRNPKVRVNAVLPGPVMLPPEVSAAEREEIIRATLVKREGSPEHVAAAVLMLVRNEFVTGVCIPVDDADGVDQGRFLVREDGPQVDHHATVVNTSDDRRRTRPEPGGERLFTFGSDRHDDRRDRHVG
jgi:pteridine reductase